MGLFSALARWLGFKKKRVSVLCLGLDNAGKTTILSKLHEGHHSGGMADDPSGEITPTVGFKVTKVDSLLPGGGVAGDQGGPRGLEFTVVDMSGAGRYRTLWDHFMRIVMRLCLWLIALIGCA